MKRLNHEDRTHLRRTVLDYRSRPQSDVPPTKAPDFERPDAATVGMALLSEELHAREAVMSVDDLDATRAERFDAAEELGADRAFRERFPDANELITERFVKKLPEPAVVCHCGTALTLNLEGNWAHVYSTFCTKPVPVE